VGGIAFVAERDPPATRHGPTGAWRYRRRVTPDDARLVADWFARPARARATVAPVAALQAAALGHVDPWVRRDCLATLDHVASDASVATFRTALDDPVAPVRLAAIHGLACERCRTEALCIADVVPRLVRAVADDPNAEVRHRAVELLRGLALRSPTALAAVQRARADDPDALVREAAARALRPGHLPGRRALARRSTPAR
jgi:HEAT repeat protein